MRPSKSRWFASTSTTYRQRRSSSLKLYKIAKLILAIREELEEKRAEAARIEAILASDEEPLGRREPGA